MGKAVRAIPAAAAILWLLAAGGLTGMPGTAAANEERVTFVENVRCNAAGTCEALRKTIPVFEMVREPDRDEFCAEYARRLIGFKTYPSLDPEQPIQMPQFELSPKRYFRCAPRDAVAGARQTVPADPGLPRL